jgi:putative ABC transport system permease protein
MLAIGRDTRDALRRLIRRPGFAVVAIATLAVAIGASAALFTFLNAVALRRLSVDRPDELVRLSTSTIDEPDSNLSFPLFQQLRRQTTVFSDVIGSVDGLNGTLELDGQRVRAWVRGVTGNYYSMLGATPRTGRLLAPTDVRLEGTGFEPAAVVSEEFWQRRLGSRLSILGQAIHLEGIDFTVIGIARRGWSGTSSSVVPDVVVPLTAMPAMNAEPSAHFFEGSGTLWLETVGRLRPGVSINAARATLSAAWPAIREAALPLSDSAADKEKFRSLPLAVTSAARGADPSMVADFVAELTMAMALVGLILVIACVNLAGLLLSRVAARSFEIGVRLSLGASRVAIARGAVIEGGLVAIAGAGGGVVVAVWAVHALMIYWYAMSSGTSRVPEGVNGGLLVFAAAAALIVAVLVSLAAVWWVNGRFVSIAGLSPAGRATPRLGRLGPTLVVGQVALSLVLVSTAALLARNVSALRSEHDIGYQRDGLVRVELQPRRGGYVNADNDHYQPGLLASIAALPGVHGAVFSSGAPFGSDLTVTVTPSAGTPATSAPESGVSPGLFGLLGVQVLSGRDFNWRDDSRAPHVAIVSRSLATALFATRPALGQHVRIGDKPDDQSVEIIGVAADAKMGDGQSPRTVRAVYVPLLQTGDAANWKMLLFRAATGVTASEKDLSSTIASFGHEYVYSVESARQWIDDTLLTEREIADVATAAAALALVLVVVGLYGLWAFQVTQRRKEMGIRLALGAGLVRVAVMIVAGGLRVAGAGILIGGIGAVATGRIIRSFLTGVSPADPVALTLAPVLMVLASVAACLVPAWRAASVDPIASLRVD